MELISKLTEKRHVIDIEATYQHRQLQVTIQEEDSIEDRKDYYLVTFKNPAEDLPASQMRIAKLDLLAFSIHHRWHEYLAEGVTMEQFRAATRIAQQKAAEASLEDQPAQIGIESESILKSPPAS